MGEICWFARGGRAVGSGGGRFGHEVHARGATSPGGLAGGLRGGDFGVVRRVRRRAGRASIAGHLGAIVPGFCAGSPAGRAANAWLFKMVGGNGTARNGRTAPGPRLRLAVGSLAGLALARGNNGFSAARNFSARVAGGTTTANDRGRSRDFGLSVTVAPEAWPAAT